MELKDRMTEIDQARLRFWTAFSEYMELKSKLKGWRPTTRSFIDYRLSPCSGLISIASTRGTVTNDPEIRAQVWIDGSDFQAHYGMLMAKRAEIETEVGQKLVWDNLSADKP